VPCAASARSPLRSRARDDGRPGELARRLGSDRRLAVRHRAVRAADGGRAAGHRRRGGALAGSRCGRRGLVPPRRERAAGRVRAYRTARGTAILVRHIPGARLAHIAVAIVGGASDEPAEHAGLTSMLVRTAIKGTAHRDAARIAADAELLGGSIAATAGAEHFGWSMSVPNARIDDALALLADV